jgi:hypothetical protein
MELVYYTVKTELLYIIQVAVMSLKMPSFYLRSIHVSFMVEKVALGQAVFQTFWLYPQHNHSTDAPYSSTCLFYQDIYSEPYKKTCSFRYWGAINRK